MENEIVLTLHLTEVQYIRKLLGKQSLDEVLGLVMKIEKQAEVQIKKVPAEEKKEIKK